MAGSAGLFVTLEGIEGAGKSTQVDLLAHAVTASGREVVATREPGGGGRVGATLRDLLKDPAVWRELGLAEIYLYAAARCHHLESVVLPALAAGRVVLCDRYLDSTRVYQGIGRGRPAGLIEALHALEPLALRPTRTLLLDLPVETGLARARARTPDDRPGYDDEDVTFFGRVRQGFLDIATREPQRVAVIDAAGEVAAVHARIVAALAADLPGLTALADAR